MNLMINTVHDLIHILNTRPEWRREVKQALFPGVDLEKALKELAEAQQRTEEGLQRLEAAQARNEELIRLLIDAQYQAEKRLNKVEKRLGNVEKRLDKVEKRLDKVELILGNHTKRLARLENKMTDAAVERQAMNERLDKIEQNQDGLIRNQNELKHNQQGLIRNQKELIDNQNDLKGKGYENDFTNKADAIFGYYLRRGRSARNEVGDHLEEPEENGLVSEQESKQVFATDLLWGGKLKSSKQQVILAVEVSWLAEKHDVERAVTRAGILRRIGLQALPVVAGVNWVDGLKEEALRQGVVIVDDKLLEQASWEAALAKMS